MIDSTSCFADKSAIHTNRFKSENFPFEYIAVDDLHYYRRRKPCNCNKSVVSFLLLKLGTCMSPKFD